MSTAGQPGTLLSTGTARRVPGCPLPDIHSIDCVFKLWYFSGIVPTQLKGEEMLKFEGLFGKIRRPGAVLLLMVFTASGTLGLTAAMGGFSQYEPPSEEARYQDLVNLL